MSDYMGSYEASQAVAQKRHYRNQLLRLEGGQAAVDNYARKEREYWEDISKRNETNAAIESLRAQGYEVSKDGEPACELKHNWDSPYYLGDMPDRHNTD